MFNSLDVCRNWLAVPHQKLYDDLQQGRGPATAEPAKKFQAELAQGFFNAVNDLKTGLKTLGGVWQGQAADNAQAAIGGLGPWLELARTAVENSGKATGSQAEAFSTAKTAMPKPVEVKTGEDWAPVKGVKNFFGVKTDRQDEEEAAKEAHLRAAQVMSTYSTSSSANVRALPTISEPPQVAVDEQVTPPPPGPGGRGGRTVAPARRGASGGGDQLRPGGTSGSDGGIPVAPQQQDGPPPPDGTQRPGTGVDDPRVAAVTPSQYTPVPSQGTPNVPGNFGPTGSGGVSGGGGGYGGFGGGVVGGGFGGATGGPGAPGNPLGRGGSAGVGGGTQVPAARTGSPGAGRGGQFLQQAAPGGAARPGEEDEEHENQYVLDSDEIFTDDRLVAPPVIGEHQE
ncbi:MULTISPECIES: PPE domain-containing protein [unclassified Crossiella]|uniref:PPE domain-containing protein n=1 Tax=unclassified Crossiella TaxID=2620835 RepID=UPI001FFF06A7|nr:MULTISPECIES: PPE domain-containing protein [unclassified Crossiella]MCK2241294.1 PPE family protein [Crossiella sp. S99.2]MCK2253562.1 PPE family protein [Crossiella sp. S99.1]